MSALVINTKRKKNTAGIVGATGIVSGAQVATSKTFTIRTKSPAGEK